MTPPPATISVALPVGRAIERVKRVLFQPFDLAKWFAIGFCAWLAQLGEAGSSPHFNFGHHRGRGGMDEFRHSVEQALNWVAQNLYWILPLAAVLLLLALALWAVILWLSSRGRFMFLHCVALDKAEVAVPWRKFARAANSLFLFRLVLGLVGTFVSLPVVALMALAAWRMIEHGRAALGGILALIGLGLLLILLAIVFWIIGRLITDFVVPIMFRRGISCCRGWGVLWGLLAGNLGRFILYFLFRIVLAFAIATVLITAVLITCCCLACFLAIPFIGTVLLLPVLVFDRAYSLHYLAQYGPEFDTFLAS
jgi:hypothetical protein